MLSATEAVPSRPCAVISNKIDSPYIRMTKKLFIILAVIGLCTCLRASADGSGRWQSYPNVGSGTETLIETPDKVYMLSGGSLLSLSSDNEEYFYSAANKLSDAEGIKLVSYNPEGKYLLVAYDNSNIDLIYDDGKVVNLPDIKDATVSSTRGIRHVSFNKGRIYVSTDFGIVVFDDKRHVVVESGIYDVPIIFAIVLGDHLLIGAPDYVKYAPVDIRHNSLDKFRNIGNMWGDKLHKLSENCYVFSAANGTRVTTFDFARGSWNHKIVLDTPSRSHFPVEGGVAAINDGKLYLITADNGGTATRVSQPSGFDGKAFIGRTTDSQWFEDEKGLSHVQFKAGVPSVTMKDYVPQGVNTRQVSFMKWTPSGDRLYMSNRGASHYSTAASPARGGMKIEVSAYEDGNFKNVIPHEVSDNLSPGLNAEQNAAGSKALRGSCTGIAVDPDDPDILFVGSWVGGFFAFKDNKMLGHFAGPQIGYEPEGHSDNTGAPYIDNEGNLWFVKRGTETAADRGKILVLPASRRKSLKDIKPSDWKTVKIPSDYNVDFDAFIGFSSRGNINFISDGKWNKGLLVMDNNGTPNNFNDDKFTHHTTLNDQTGSQVSLEYIMGATEDHEGRWWFNTSQGVWVIDRPADAMSRDFKVRRPVVPRNDGTGLGDYLLDSEKIYMIAIDASNRKWMATENSGVYLVSADGTEILEHFTTSNSPLLSDCVYSVTCDPNSNRVYFGTANGLMSYDGDSAPAADDYSDVYAYPNPIRPDYTGWITIAGLMENSLVKIADAAGNVFYQGRSEGGMASWDGCDSSGRRARSGVYYVFASQNATGSASGAVCKILIVN